MEWGKLYPDFAENADEEGFKRIANTFRGVAKVEKYHEHRYRKLLANMKQKTVFKKGSVVKWKCRNCGFVFKGNRAPEKCPVCSHDRNYFLIWCENY